MALEIDGFPSFCLICERQIDQGVCCASTCCLADIKNTKGSRKTSPLVFYLRPPINFMAYSCLSGVERCFTGSLPEPSPPTMPIAPLKKDTSSGRFATSSVLESLATHGLSSKASGELESYFGSFDRIRELKRQRIVPYPSNLIRSTSVKG